MFIGVLSAYGQRPTDGTLLYRQERDEIPQDLGEYEVFLSVPNCGLIGHEGVLNVNDNAYSALVFDCAGPGENIGHDWMLKNNVAAEVDYYFWKGHPEFVGTEMMVTIEIETIEGWRYSHE